MNRLLFMKHTLLTLIITCLFFSTNKAACAEKTENQEKENKATAHARSRVHLDPFLPQLPLELQDIIKKYLIDPFDFLPIYLQGKDLSFQDKNISDIAINDNGIIVASHFHSPFIETWDKHGKQTQIIDSGSLDTRAIALDNDNNIILGYCSRNDGGIYEYGIKILKQDGTLLNTLPGGHKRKINAIACCNDTIVTGADERIIKIWNHKKCTLMFESPNRGNFSVAISRDGRTIIFGGQPPRNNNFVAHIFKDQQPSASLDHTGSSPTCADIAISSDGQTVATIDTYKIQIWDVNTGDKKTTFEIQESYLYNLLVEGVSYLSNTMLAASYSSGAIRFWRPDGTIAATLQFGGNEAPCHIITGKDNTLVAACLGNTSDGKIKLWKPNEELLYTLSLQQLDFISQLIAYIQKDTHTAELEKQTINFSAEQVAQFKQLPGAVKTRFQDFYQIKIEPQQIEQKHFAIQ